MTSRRLAVGPGGEHGWYVSDGLLREQIAYYQRRAGEYDATAYGDLTAARSRIDRIVAELPPARRALELACGTGMWTRALATRTTQLVAVDAALETVGRAKTRCPPAVGFVCADVFEWVPRGRFDLVFFAFWLSHVPSRRVPDFFDSLSRLLTPTGQVVFVDEHLGRAGKETVSGGNHEVAQRTLSDGSEHRLVKVYVDPDRLAGQLQARGWTAFVTPDGPDWIVGTCRRS